MANQYDDVPTLTVLASESAVRNDGTTALVLQTKEAGTIAIAVDLKGIEILRRQLAACETVLTAPKGNA